MSLKQEALDSMADLQSVRQGTGKMGYMLRRCRPGTKRHKQLWDALTLLEREADELASKIRLALNSIPD
jgi:hypothetical protein